MTARHHFYLDPPGLPARKELCHGLAVEYLVLQRQLTEVLGGLRKQPVSVLHLEILDVHSLFWHCCL